MLELLDRHIETTGQGRWSRRVTNDPAIAPYLLAGTRLEAFGQLRYELFVERDGKAYAHADHANRVLLEPADRVSLNFGVVKNGECLVGVRLTKGSDAHIDEQLSKLLTRYPHLDRGRVVLNSRLAVAPGGQSYIPALFRQVYRAVILEGAAFGLVAARPALAALFERFGYVRGSAAFADSLAGELLPLCLDGNDVEHFRKVRSPFLRPRLELSRELEMEPSP